jgi:hypothetical protein
MPRELRDDGRTYHDVAHARAVREARALVVEKAREYRKEWQSPSGYDAFIAIRNDLFSAIRALDAVERGEP